MYRYQAGKADWLGAGLPREGRESTKPRVGDMARRDVATCRLGEPVNAARERAREGGWMASVVVDDQRVVLGLVDTGSVDGAATSTVEEMMDPAPLTFRPDVGIDELADTVRKPRAAPVLVTTLDGILIGLLEASSHRG